MKNEKALKQAKANVDRYFKVVGVLENLNETLAVLENRIPRYFDGLQDMYFNELMSKENGIWVHNLSLSLTCHCIYQLRDKNQNHWCLCAERERRLAIFVSSCFYLSVCLLQSRISTKIKIIPGRWKNRSGKNLGAACRWNTISIILSKRNSCLNIILSSEILLCTNNVFIVKLNNDNSSKKFIPVI